MRKWRPDRPEADKENMKPIDLGIDNYQETVKAFHSETDRAAAVLAGSFVECFLAKYMRSAMVPEAKDELFGNNGPFATYSQRVQAAHAFGMISTSAKRDLELIGKIRNHFAHHPLNAAFNEAPVVDWCNSLSTVAVFSNTEIEQDKRLGNRNRFIVAVSCLVADWHNTLLND